jgi:hypothetical protein
MADKVTGNPYEHKKQPILCQNCVYDFSQGMCERHNCPTTGICESDCPACIWEVVYKAGQTDGEKIGMKRVVDWVEAIGNWGHLLRVHRWAWEEMKGKWGLV